MFMKKSLTACFTLILALICCSHVDAQDIQIEVFGFPVDSSQPDRVPISSNATFRVVYGILDTTTNSPTTATVDQFDLLIFESGATPPIHGVTGLGIFSNTTPVFTSTDFPELFGTFNSFSFSLPTPVVLSDNDPSRAIAEFSLDTSGLSDGDFVSFGLAASQFFIGDERINTTALLSFNFEAEAIPEPSSACVLLGLGCVAALRRKRV